MPKASSKKQQMAAGAALSAKRGERSKSSLKGASKQMADSMSEKELHDMASVKRKKLPKRNAAKSGGGRSSSARSRSGGSARSSTKSRSSAKGRSSSSSRKSSSKRSSRSSSR
jgi:hypothetical protein